VKNPKRITLSAPIGVAEWWAAFKQREVAGQRVIVLVALGLILALALYLRLSGVNWDSDQHMNPDERHSTNVGAIILSNAGGFPTDPIKYFDTADSQLNPYNNDFPEYVWGTFPLFGTMATADFLGKGDYGHINLVGRVLSAFVDVGSIIFIFLLGSYLFDRRVGLLAAFLLSVTALHIQYSHYFVVDGWLAFFSLASLYFSARAAKEGGRWNFTLAGAMFGLAMASKVSAIPLALIITMAAAIRAWPALKDRWERREAPITPASLWSNELEEPLIGLVLAAVVALAVFRVVQPYAFVGPYPWSLDIRAFLDDPTDPLNLFINPVWRRDLQQVLDRQTGDGFYPPSWTWVGRVPWLYGLQNMFLWGMGIPLFLAAAGGVFYAGWRVIRHREVMLLLLLAWILITFLWQAGRFTSYMRYVLPVYPPMVLLGAYVLVQLWQTARLSKLPGGLQRFLPRLNACLPPLARLAVGSVVVLTLLYGLAFTSIYRSPLTRVEASRWIYANVPEGSRIADFHWDDGLPLNVDGQDSGAKYEKISLELYEFDDEPNIAELIDDLSRADYIAVSSDRLYRSIPRAPAVYPTATRFFDHLFAEDMGFDRVATFTSFPSLFGVAISDDGAEESFTVYDHPKVLIYKKNSDFSRDKVATLLHPPSIDAIIVPPSEAGKNALMLRPGEIETQRSGGTWTDIFDADSFFNENSGLAWIIWLLPVELLSLALVPAGLYLFRWLPDRGYLLLKPLGLLLLVYLVWLSVSLHMLEFTRGTILGLGLLVITLGIASSVVWRRQVLDYVRQHWRAILTAEAVFLGAFLIFYLLRLHNPDLWHPARGGEKPMDFAYLNAITRSTTLPPYDPWFAGGYINYYYFGQFITATLLKLTRVLPEIGYNLAVPMFFALTTGAVYSVGYNLAAATCSRIRRRPGGGRIPASSLVGAGLLAVLLALIVGNLHTFDEAVDDLSAMSSVHLGNGIPIFSGAVGAIGGLSKVVFTGADFPAIDYWRPTRMFPPTISITEFPFFSFLFADLHAHLMSIPFAVTSLGVSLGLVLAGTAERRPGRWISSAGALALVILLAFITGALRWTNSWDYPPFLLLGIAAVFISERSSEGRLSWPMAVRSLTGAALMVVLSIVTFYPFEQNYQQFQAGLHGSVETTVLSQYLSHFGLFIVIITGLVTFLWARMLRRTELVDAIRLLVFTAFGLVFLTVLLIAFTGPLESLLPITITNLSAEQFLEDFTRVRAGEGTTPGLGIPLLPFAYLALAAVTVVAVYEIKRDAADSPLRLFVLAMLAMALGLSIGVDVVNIDNDIQRMNTVFKFYIHIWLLLALTSAFAAWYLLAVTRLSVPALRRLPRLEIHRLATARQLWVATAAALFLAALVYPLAATPERLNDRFQSLSPTANGLAFMEEAVYQDAKGPVELRYDLEAIQWLRENVDGSPVIMEAHTGVEGPPLYSWGSRFSIYTGLPTVIGWDNHQNQQRGKFSSLVRPRQDDVALFYSDLNPAEALRILQKYQVSYVAIGQLERLYYPAEGLAKFEDGLGGNLELVYENPQTRIYRVRATQAPLTTLDAASDSRS